MSAMQILLLLLIVTIIGNQRTVASNYEKEFENGDFGGNSSLLDWKSFLKSHNIVASDFKDDVGINSMCRRDLAVLEDALTKEEIWALKMLDASSKIPSSIKQSYEVDSGSLDKCINVKDVPQGVEIRGHQCEYSVIQIIDGVNFPKRTALSICAPSTCNDTDIIYLVQSSINRIDKLKDRGIMVTSATCKSKHEVFWDAEFVFFLVLFTAYIGFLIFCTLVDVLLNRYNAGKDTNSVFINLAKFSMIKSASSIFSLRVREDNLSAITGMRCLAMISVIVGHAFVLSTIKLNIKAPPISIWLQHWSSIIPFLTFFQVDTFFTIAGFLMTYIFLKEMKKRKSFNILGYYAYRYIRLTPALLAMVVIATVFFPKFHTGPRWDILSVHSGETCRIKWWSYIFYLHNMVHMESPCLPHLWYLAVDMQLFWISPLILYPLHKKPKLGLTILFTLFLASVLVPTIVSMIKQYSALVYFNRDGSILIISDTFIYFYTLAYARAGPWLVGIIFGYTLANHNRKLGKFAVFIGWLVGIGAILSCIGGVAIMRNPNYEYNMIFESVFTGLSKPLWGVGICWIIYASLHNYGGLFSKMLASKYFIPLSRISYSIYIVSLVLQLWREGLQHHFSYNFAATATSYQSSIDVILSFVGGFFFCLLFESPIMVLEQMIFKKKQE